MRRVATVLALSFASSPAFGQAVVQPRAFQAAPWWMERPIIASVGRVWTETQANRAFLGATYDSIDRDAATAQRQATDKVRALTEALREYGPERVRVETTLRVQPLYDQYKDKQGEVAENQRADKIERYQVIANVSVEVRDVRLVERVYAAMLGAKPASTQQVNFRLDAPNDILTEMSKLAVEDAKRRAVLATQGAGATLGAVKLIDPTGRACETDVLVTGAGRAYDDTAAQEVVVTGARRQAMGAPPPPPPPIPPLPVPPVERRIADPVTTQLTLQPPMRRLEARTCVVFALG